MPSAGSEEVLVTAMTMMHSAVCSSVSAGVARRLLESTGGCSSNMRKGNHDAVDCQAFGRSGFNSAPKKNSKESLEFTRIEKLRLFPVLKGGAGVLYTKAFASNSEESNSRNGNVVRGENSSWAGVRGRSDEAKPGGGGDQGQNLVHALHEAAAVFQSAMEEHESLTRGPWFAQKWLGIDKNAWMRSLAYQAITHTQIF